YPLTALVGSFPISPCSLVGAQTYEAHGHPSALAEVVCAAQRVPVFEGLIKKISIKGRHNMLNLSSSRLSARFTQLALVALSALLLCSVAFAQTSVSNGSISGTVTDATGAVVPNAKVTMTGPTGQTVHATTSGAGTYSSGALVPGTYSVRAEAKGFKTMQLSVDVQVNNTANGSIKLEIGQESTVVEVQASEVSVNTEQAEVQGVLTASQIENLPVNGRNFLDLAQLEPGVQIQDGANFDPTKVGYSSISFGGRFGRTARISVDGVDVSDETVGTTTPSAERDRRIAN